MGALKEIALDAIHIGTGGLGKKEVLEEIASFAAGISGLERVGKKKLLKAFTEREKVCSTAFGEGIAIPHCTVPKADRFYIGLAIYSQGVEFEALDQDLTHTIFFIVAPENQRNRHVQILSSISNLMRVPGVSARILETKDPQSLKEFLADKIQYGHADKEREQACQVTVHVQNEDYFNEILEELSSDVEGTVVVLESRTAGQYLNQLPLFAAMWGDSNDNSQKFNKTIMAIVPKVTLNETIRKIRDIVPNIGSEEGEGILVTAQDLLYCSGSIDF